MTRAVPFLLALGLTACAAPPPPSSMPGVRFTLGEAAGGSAASAVAVAAQPVAAQPVPTATDQATPAPVAAASTTTGGSGGGASGARPIEGAVRGVDGALLAGAIITGAGAPLATDALGRFTVGAAGAAPLLTASLAGYVAQTLGPPYRFELALVVPAEPVPYTLAGITDPPTPGALVAFTDAHGVEVRGLTGPDGRFSLTVPSRSATPASGLLVVSQGVAWAGSARYRLLQAGPTLAGAIVTPGTAQTDLRVALEPVTERLAIATADLPAGLRAAGAELSLVAPDGPSVVLNWSDGTWPAEVPVPRLSGLRTVVRLSAQDSEATAWSRAEHVVAPGETAWAPRLLSPPDVTVDGEGHVSWPAGPATTTLVVAPHPQTQPTWEGRVSGSALKLPVDAPGGELIVRAWDISDPPMPSRARAPKNDRRSASRRVALPTPAPAAPAE